MNKNVKFAYTVSTKKFTKKIADLLELSVDETNHYLNIENAVHELRNENYELFYAYLANARSDLELLLIAMNDAEDNIRGFLDIGQQKLEPQQQTISEPKTEVVQSAPTVDPFAQLQQLQSLVNTIKDLKPKE